MTPAPTPLDAATFIVQLLREQGHVAYFAGGCVRDALLGLTPKDYDVATDALPEKVAAIFRNTQFVGEAFGVTLVKLKGFAVEVATFRREWGYADGRHPSHVEFCSAEQDAQRRDFTINGLFENPLATKPDERIIDYVGGLQDLEQGIVRAIGQAEDRFAEDYLRMLRAVRFASRYGFVIEQQTADAIRRRADYLGVISRERIGQEVQTMFSQPLRAPRAREGGQSMAPSRKAASAAAHMVSLKLDGQVLDEAPSAEPGVVLPKLDTLADDHVDYPALLLGWMLDRHQALGPDPASGAKTAESLRQFVETSAGEIIGRWRKALVLSNAITAAMTQTLGCLAQSLAWSDMSVAGRKRLLASSAWPRALALLTACGHVPMLATLATRIKADSPELLASGVAPLPWVSGDDLVRLGQKPGPSFRRLLDHAYDEQLEGRLVSRPDALRWLEELIKKQSP